MAGARRSPQVDSAPHLQSPSRCTIFGLVAGTHSGPHDGPFPFPKERAPRRFATQPGYLKGFSPGRRGRGGIEKASDGGAITNVKCRRRTVGSRFFTGWVRRGRGLSAAGVGVPKLPGATQLPSRSMLACFRCFDLDVHYSFRTIKQNTLLLFRYLHRKRLPSRFRKSCPE